LHLAPKKYNKKNIIYLIKILQATGLIGSNESVSRDSRPWTLQTPYVWSFRRAQMARPTVPGWCESRYCSCHCTRRMTPEILIDFAALSVAVATVADTLQKKKKKFFFSCQQKSSVAS